MVVPDTLHRELMSGESEQVEGFSALARLACRVVAVSTTLMHTH